MSKGKRAARYAPPRDDGLKPWVVERAEWGRRTERVVYAETRSAAEYEVKGRQRYVTARGRRATSEDMERLS
jgi:hypothetical protein